MAIPRHQKLNETFQNAYSPSIGATPSAVSFIVPRSGTLFYASLAGAVGTLGGTELVTLTVGATTVGTFSVAAGAAPADVGSGDFAFPVTEGDVIVATPSGGTGASITGTFTIGVRG